MTPYYKLFSNIVLPDTMSKLEKYYKTSVIMYSGKENNYFTFSAKLIRYYEVILMKEFFQIDLFRKGTVRVMYQKSTSIVSIANSAMTLQHPSPTLLFETCKALKS